MFPKKNTYKYEVEYQATDSNGRHKRKRVVELSKDVKNWSLKDYSKLEEYLKQFHKGNRVNVNVIEVKECI